ncbi:hypothetical protein MMC13_002744 [Lambiella insularis]|nr:hypothetical protein [Lambiella insularis]
MVKKDKRAKTAEQKARVVAKQSKKAAQKEKKGRSKDNDDSDADNVDLESVLEEYAKQQALFLKVTEVACDPPSARASSTIIGSPANSNELFLFGGEYYNGVLATFFNDLFVYLIDRGEWRKVTSPNTPLPRSGHAWCRGGKTGGVYLFGGEFSSPKQGTFYHYNDFWRFDPSTREWTRLESKGKRPPARSGHRMTYFKNYIILFGGFQDTSQQTRYLQDLWIYDCQNYIWHNPLLPPATQKPDPRSSFSFLPHDLGAVIYGGYSRVKATTVAGKQNKAGHQGAKSVLKPLIHQDTWFLRILHPPPEAPAGQAPTVRWERRKKPANAPNPSRAGATMAYHKGRGILFGGVHDVEESEEGIDSEFFDQLFAWNVERNRYFQLALRRPRIANKRQPLVDRGTMKRGRGKVDEEDLLRNLAALENPQSGRDPDAMDVDPFTEQNEEPAKPQPQVHMTMPHPRFNAQLAVQDDVLYIFGGTYEQGDREWTFDEMHAIDLGKLDGVKEIYRRELENWHGSDDEETDTEDEEDDSEDEKMVGDDSGGVPLPPADDEKITTSTPVITSEVLVDVEEEQAEAVVEDDRPHPRPFENLRDFFARTSNDWQNVILESLRKEDSSFSGSVKEVRKVAFELAETKWWDCREEITALEDQQEEAGIGEIVSTKDRAIENGGAGRRR